MDKFSFDPAITDSQRNRPRAPLGLPIFYKNIPQVCFALSMLNFCLICSYFR